MPFLYIKMTDYQQLYFLYHSCPHLGIVVNERTRILKSFHEWAGEGVRVRVDGGPRALGFFREAKPFSVSVFHLSITYLSSIVYPSIAVSGDLV